MSALSADVLENQSEAAALDSALYLSSEVSDGEGPLEDESSLERSPGRNEHTIHQQADICFIGRLPNELLYSIFLEWRQLDGLGSLLASHVCRKWRNIALSSPLLWTALVVDGISDLDNRKRDAHNAALWLERSQGRLYNLRIDPNRINDHALTLTLPPSLPDNLDCLVELQTFGFDEKNVNGFMVLHGSKFSDHLEALQIWGHGIRTRPRVLAAQFLTLTSMPSLMYLDLRDIKLAVAPLPFSRLKFLRLRFPGLWAFANHPLELLSRIRHLSSLEDLSLTSDAVYNIPSERRVASDGSGIQPVRVPFPVLGRLELEGAAHWNEFFDRITLPGLHTLELESCTHMKVSELLDTLDPPALPVRRLELRDPGYLENGLASRLRHISSLEHLAITYSPNLSDSFIESMLDASSSPRLTRLETLDFSGSRGITGDGIIRALRSHMSSPAPSGLVSAATSSLPNEPGPNGAKRIKHLRLLACPKVDEEAITKLAERVPMVTNLPPSSSQLDDGWRDGCNEDAFPAGRNY